MAQQFTSQFPVFKSFARINSLSKADEPTSFFDCKFYPYTEPGVDPVFAVVGKAETFVCRPLKSDSAGIEVIAWFHDDDPNASLNSCVWSQDLETGDPLLCVAGPQAAVNVFNVRSKKLIKTLIGHGKDINDLAVSPLSPSILASASLDYSVRFWSLDPKHKKQPCILICGGEGHREGLLSLAFHATGRYLLTGGMDNVVNLWVIPELPNKDSGTDKPTLLHYPHFSTSALHTNVVDCLTFYNDLIISRCSNENMIVVWRIDEFDSSIEPPARAPTTHEFRPTRSAWGGGYQRLFQFDAPKTPPFYVRFSLFQAPLKRPILAIGNNESKIYFWDLQTLEEWDEQTAISDEIRERVKNKGNKGKGRRGGPRPGPKHREASVASSTTTGQIPIASSDSRGDTAVYSKTVLKYSVEDPFRKLLSHAEVTVPRVSFAARQVAWSMGGEWMVVVGDQGMVALFAR